MVDVWRPKGMYPGDNPASILHLHRIQDAERTMEGIDPSLRPALEQIQRSHYLGHRPFPLTPMNGAHVFGDRFHPLKVPDSQGIIPTTVTNWGDKIQEEYEIDFRGERRVTAAHILLDGGTAVGLHIPTGYRGHHLLIPDGELPDVLRNASKLLRAIGHTMHQGIEAPPAAPITVFQMSR